MANDAIQLCNGNTCVQLCNGNACVQLCTRACECPCDQWLPSAWPCGGLNEEYTVSIGAYLYQAWFPLRDPGDVCANAPDFQASGAGADIVVTATDVFGDSCHWYGEALLPPDSTPVLVHLYLAAATETLPCRWEVSIAMGAANASIWLTAWKPIGQTPAGGADAWTGLPAEGCNNMGDHGAWISVASVAVE